MSDEIFHDEELEQVTSLFNELLKFVIRFDPDRFLTAHKLNK